MDFTKSLLALASRRVLNRDGFHDETYDQIWSGSRLRDCIHLNLSGCGIRCFVVFIAAVTLPSIILINKVLVYITKGSKLLVFKHTDFPEAGIQVPAGTIEAGETPLEALKREIVEETGLSEFGEITLLAEYDYDMSAFRDEIQHRFVFHVVLIQDAPAEWQHYETSSASSKVPIAFDFFWIELDEAQSQLIAGQGDYLPLLISPGIEKFAVKL
jgi:8-oxo-dGTP diphosphatase